MHYIQLEVCVVSPQTFGLHNRKQKEVSLIAGLNTGGYNGHTAKLFSNTQLKETEMTPWYAKQWQTIITTSVKIFLKFPKWQQCKNTNSHHWRYHTLEWRHHVIHWKQCLFQKISVLVVVNQLKWRSECFNIQNLYILPTKYMYIIHMIPKINSNYFHV